MKNNNSVVVIAIIAVLAIAAGLGYALMSNSKPAKTSDTTSMTDKAMTPKSPDASSSKTTPAAANSITIENYKFSPASMSVKVGTKVTWTNNDSVKHTVTTDSGDGPNSSLFGKGETYSYTFTKAGTYSYHCQPHSYMKATITVTE